MLGILMLLIYIMLAFLTLPAFVGKITAPKLVIDNDRYREDASFLKYLYDVFIPLNDVFGIVILKENPLLMNHVDNDEEVPTENTL